MNLTPDELDAIRDACRAEVGRLLAVFVEGVSVSTSNAENLAALDRFKEGIARLRTAKNLATVTDPAPSNERDSIFDSPEDR